MKRKKVSNILRNRHLSKGRLYSKIVLWVFFGIASLETLIVLTCYLFYTNTFSTFVELTIMIAIGLATSTLVTVSLITVIRWIIENNTIHTITRSKEDHHTLTELYKAVEKSELCIYYQPQINLQTGQLVGMETLIRWNHSERGFISPSEFIPLAEESGLIIAIDNWIIKQACIQNKIWLDQGFNLRVAANISAIQFKDFVIVDTIAQILQQTQLPAQNLELEITETAMISDMEKAIAIMHKLRALGVVLSMDDFGTGYASLSSLDRFPIQKLKIDKVFVHNVNPLSKGPNLTENIIQMGHSLNLIILAEGIETSYQKNYFTQLKCDEAQGYYFGKPVPAEEFILLFTHNFL